MNREMKEMYRKTDKDHKKSSHMAKGGKMGGKTHKTSGYEDSDWSKVDAMVSGKHPTTNLCTNRVAGK
jgi:hypothetical protein